LSVLVKRPLAIAVILLVVLYIGDYLSVRIRMSGSNSAGALGSIQIRRYWEIPSKSGKFEYSFDPPQMQTCVHSLFPHLGYTPCWYLNRNKLQRVARVQAPQVPARTAYIIRSSLGGRSFQFTLRHSPKGSDMNG
jgi:hypothetical protein